MNGHDLLWFAVSLQLIAVRQLNRSWRKHPNLLLAFSWSSRGEEIPAMTRTLAWQAFDSRNGKRLCKGSQRSPFRLSIFVFRTLWTLHLLFALLNKQVKFWPCNRSHQIDLPLISRWTWALAANLYFGQEWKVRGGASHNAVPRETFTLVWGSCGVWRFEPGEPGKPFLQPLLFVLCWAWKSCNARCLLYHALHSVDNATNQ